MNDRTGIKISYSENSGSPEFVVSLSFRSDAHTFSDVANIIVGVPFDENMTYSQICHAAAQKARELAAAIARDEGRDG